LGLGDKVSRLTPNLIPNLNNIIQISAGGIHSLLLNNKSDVFSFGNNDVIFFLMKSGQLGVGDNNIRYIPTLFYSSLNLIQVSCGEFYSLIQNKNGQIFSFGYNQVLNF
jgi:alpha-tubulin suppressor-like RCC1 family protein